MVRGDGWPQASTVGYVNDGLALYVGCGADSQKVRNIRHCPKLSLTVDHDQADWSGSSDCRWAPTPTLAAWPS
jgi:nitroimidazol reductase NimA-like FMN-containing flavoprotein (pyridoxamine 5'-phosphate oxidase superfamily)